MKLKVLFIGGTGIISTEVSKLCVKKGIDLHLLNRGNRKTIEGTKSIKCDISDFKISKDILKDYSWDVVVNWIAFNKDDIERDIKLFSGKTKQ